MNEYISINEHGKYYFKDKKMTILHREDGPAVEYPVSGAKEWWLNGKLHRMDGPAIEYVYGLKLWYVNDMFIFAIDKSGNIISRMK